MKERATVEEWLRWFYREADFGPADSDIRNHLKECFMSETGKNLPVGYEIYSDEEDSEDE